LKQEGYVKDIDLREITNGRKEIAIVLKYRNSNPAIQDIQRVSTPGRRVYKKADELKAVLSGFGVSIVSTSSGLMTNKEAKSRSLGGEIICEVY
jgi:small subunit ribosomal protein S8